MERVQLLLLGQARREEVRLEVNLVPELPRIAADERRFKQLIYHLVLKALDRSAPGDTVFVEAAPSWGGSVRLSVTNSGPALSEAERGRSPLPGRPRPRRAAPSARRAGPEPVRQPGDEMNGELMVSTDAQGTHFVVEIPSGAAAEA